MMDIGVLLVLYRELLLGWGSPRARLFSGNTTRLCSLISRIHRPFERDIADELQNNKYRNTKRSSLRSWFLEDVGSFNRWELTLGWAQNVLWEQFLKVQ
jgi:hypothetical protein